MLTAKKFVVVFWLFLPLQAKSIRSDHIFTFWIKSHPLSLDVSAETQNGNFLLENNLSLTGGIIVSYGGYLATTDLTGQVTFPHLQQQPSFTLMITSLIKPIFMLGNTIHHWELIPGIPFKCYTIDRKQDMQTKIYFWNVEGKSCPANNIVPLNAIIVFINPDSLLVPEGITITHEQDQLILPSLYFIKNNEIVKPSLDNLTIKAFFSNIGELNKKQKENYYSTQITVNN